MVLAGVAPPPIGAPGAFLCAGVVALCVALDVTGAAWCCAACVVAAWLDTAVVVCTGAAVTCAAGFFVAGTTRFCVARCLAVFAACGVVVAAGAGFAGVVASAVPVPLPVMSIPARELPPVDAVCE